MVEPPATFNPPPNAREAVREAWWQQMQDWLAQELDREHVENMRRANANPWRPKPQKKPTAQESAIAAAWKGDLEPLRRLHPKLVPFLRLPKRPAGRRPNRQKAFAPAKLAARFVPRIRKFWQQKYGEKNRSQYEEEISAEAFAAAIGNEWFEPDPPLDFDTVKAAAKPSGKHKQPRRKKPRQ